MLKVYHAPNTRSVRIVWLCEELGLDYEKVALEFDPKVLQSENYLKINPLGKVPSMEEDGLVINESGAIVQYLLEKTGDKDLQPALGTPERGRYLHWFHFAEATLMPPLGNIAQHAFIRPEEKRISAVAEEGKEMAIKILKLLDKELEGRSYIAGEKFSAADIMLGYDLLLAKLFGLLTDAMPNVLAYFNRLAERPAFKKATGQ
jgi:glutathione S-transferase